MGVVSNKINIMELMKSGGGGDPTIPGRVSALENEMTGVYASINQISTVELPKVYSSISEITTVELPKVYSSISAVSNLILEPVTGLEDRVEVLESPVYATSEKVIGTWIDNKPIYEQFIRLENISTTQIGTVYNYTSSDAYLPKTVYDTLISFEVALNYGGYFSCNGTYSAGSDYIVTTLTNNGRIAIDASSSLSNVNLTVRLVYTKKTT